MADTKTSALSAAAQPDGSGGLAIPAVQSGGSVKVTDAQLLEMVQDSLGGGFVVVGNGYRLVYDDAGNTLTLFDCATRADKTASYSVLQADVAKTIRGDATSGAITITLPASLANDGDRVHIRKTDNSANRVTVQNSSAADVAWLSTQLDEVTFVWWNGGFVAEEWNIRPLRLSYTSTTAAAGVPKPPLAASFDCMMFGAGGGGGSGRCGNTGAARSGGAGGTPGNALYQNFPASYFAAAGETFTCGGAGTGGAATSTNASSNIGGAGGDSTLTLAGSVSTTLKAPGGLAVAASGAASISQTVGAMSMFPVGAGGNTSVGGTAPTPAASAIGAGAGGGSVTSGEAAQNGGAGGAGSCFNSTPIGGGTAGVASTSAGGAGSSITDANFHLGGGGGGGGGAATSGAAFAGGAGGAPGGGGGGGGASVTGSNSGKGGDGGRGELRLVWYFH